MNMWVFLPVTRGSGRRHHEDMFSEGEPLDWMTGCCILLKREVLERVGLLDPAYFASFEDVDWSLRMSAAGYAIKFSPRARIYHYQSASTTSVEKQKEGFMSPFRHYLNIRNHLFLLRRHCPWYLAPSAWLYQCVKIGGYLLYFIVRRRWQKLRAVIKGLRDGLTQAPTRLGT